MKEGVAPEQSDELLIYSQTINTSSSNKQEDLVSNSFCVAQHILIIFSAATLFVRIYLIGVY